MIMPCMKSTSAGDFGGSTAFVEGGKTFVGAPGAPGCTTTGAVASFFCAKTHVESKVTVSAIHANVVAAAAAARRSAAPQLSARPETICFPQNPELRIFIRKDGGVKSWHGMGFFSKSFTK